MTTGPIGKRMISFAIPVFIGHLFQQLYNTADSIIVGNFVGKQALAAVASSGNLIFMMTGFFMGLCMGAGVIIGRYLGAKDYERMKKAIHTAVAFALCCGLTLSVLGLWLAPKLLVLMKTPENVLPLSITYFRIYFFGSFFSLTYNVCAGIMQAVGDSKNPLRFLIASSITNVVLDLLFVGVFRWGVSGAATATVISQMLSAVLGFRKLIRSEGYYQLHVREIGFNIDRLKEILRQGIPSGINNSIISIANVVVQSNINAFGDDAMAGCGSYAKVEGFIFLPIMALSMAITTFISQNLGAGNHERALKGSRFGIICAVVSAEALGLILWLTCPWIIPLFNSDPAVVEIGVNQMRTEAFFYFLLAFAHAVSAVMRGAGRAKMPMYTMLLCWCLIRVAYVTVAVQFFPVINTVYWAYPLTWFLSCIIFLAYYLKGDWLHTYDYR
ncbi:MAG: MATE family efflux transporter [Oscillospiraceae bacterium]|nr:MATE family efflux transporter [Oscillospiraceae bacterium]MBQ4643484.1 MATE family efflux transporter [Oscillospiraceae bacterium]